MMPMQKSSIRSLTVFAMLLATGVCQQAGAAEFWWRHQQESPVRTMIQTDAPTYASGAAVSIRLTNRTGRTVGYNLCRARLERLFESAWEGAQASLAEVCTAELRRLRPGQSASFVFTPDYTFREGEYRVRADLHDPMGGAPLEALSNNFTLTRTRLD